MKRIEEFEMALENLMADYADLSYEDLADSLEYYSDECRTIANQIANQDL